MCLNHLRLTVKAITAYCRKFPQALVRAWKYNNEVEEFFVEDETVVKVKRADIYRERHTTEMDDLQLKCQICSHVRSYICIYQYIYIIMYERQSCYLKHSETVLYIFITNIYIYK